MSNNDALREAALRIQHELSITAEATDPMTQDLKFLVEHALAADKPEPSWEPNKATWNAAQDLLGRYWQLAFREGSEGVNLAEEANQVLSEFRDLLAADKALRSQAIPLSEDQRKMLSVTGDVSIPGAADKAGGEVVAEVVQRESYEDGSPNPCKTLKWRLRSCEDDLQVGTLLYTHPQPQPSALPDDVVKDAERLDWIVRQGDEFTSRILVDCPGDGNYYVSGGYVSGEGETFRAAIDAAMLKEGK